MEAVIGVNLSFRNVIFDNWSEDIEDELGTHYWAGVCEDCVIKHQIENELLDDSGMGTCDIKGCNKEAYYYIDFIDNEVRFIEESKEDIKWKIMNNTIDMLSIKCYKN